MRAVFVESWELGQCPVRHKSQETSPSNSKSRISEFRCRINVIHTLQNILILRDKNLILAKY